MTPHEAELLEEFKRGSPEAIAKANRAFDGMSLSQFRDVIGKTMVDFVHRHCGKPIKTLQTEVNELRAEGAELRRRISALEK